MRFPFSRRSILPEVRVEPEIKAALPVEVKSDADAAAVLATLSSLTTSDPVWLTEILDGGSSHMGEVFSPPDAMRCPASRRAVQIIAETIAALPIHIYAVAKDGTRSRDIADPNDRFLNLTPNGWMAASQFRECLTRDALLWGAGFGFINRRADGSVIGLERQMPGRVSTQVDQETGEPSYIVGDRRIACCDMLVIQAPFVHWPLEASPTRDGREAISTALVMGRHAARLFTNGARPAGILAFPKDVKLPAERVRNIGRLFSALHSGKNSGSTAVMTDGATYTQTELTSVDAQFLEQRRFSIEDIGRVYGVPPNLLGEMGRATYSNAEEMGRVFVNYTLVPWMRRWEAEINLKLFSSNDLGRREVEHDTDSLLRADFVQRMEGHSKAISARIMNPNEVRRREGLGPVPEGEAFINPAIISADDQADR